MGGIVKSEEGQSSVQIKNKFLAIRFLLPAFLSSPMRDHYDIVIIGSGIGGGTMAFPLARIGAKVLVVEKSRHPRFAIGESTIPSSTFMWRRLHEKYNVPEYIRMSHYLGMKEAGLTGNPKAGFWFGLHRVGEELRPEHELQLETLKLPLGPDVHMVRSEIDQYLASRFPAYGIDYTDQTDVAEFEFVSTTKKSRLTLNKDGKTRTIQCNLVADASGHRGFFAQKFNLLEDPALFKTNSRSIFGHFRNVGRLEELYPPNPVFRIGRDGETQHHCFRGGWIWVIPFDNGVTSVGAMLNPDAYPEQSELQPEEELREICRRFPSVQMQLKTMEAVTPIIRTGRVQFKVKSMVGDGYIMTPHASGFVDALFSTGLAFSASFVSRFIPAFKLAMADNDYSRHRFQPLEDAFFHELKQVDLLVSASYESWRDYDVMKQVKRWWATCNMFHFITMIFADLDDYENGMLVFGSSVKAWRDKMKTANEIVFDKSLSDAEAARKLKAMNDEIPVPFDLINSEIGSDKACLFTMTNPHKGAVEFFYEKIMKEPELKRSGRMKEFASFIAKLAADHAAMRSKYAISRMLGTDFAKDIDRLHELTAARGHVKKGAMLAPFDWY